MMIKDEVGIDLENFSKEAEIEKFKDIKMQGWSILVRLYITPQQTKKGIILPGQFQDDEKYRNCVGLVVKKSTGAYLDARYNDTGPWCKVGDWVVFPRHAGYRILYKNLPVFVLKEDAIDAVVEDPSIVSRST